MSERDSICASEEKPAPKNYERHLVERVRSGLWFLSGCEVWAQKTTRSNVPKRIDIPSRGGYRRIPFGLNNLNASCLAHRLIWQVYHGDIPDGMVINHINCIRDDNRIENLELCTVAGNNRYTASLGRLSIRRGELASNAKLVASDVRKIRELFASRVSQAELSRRFGVGRVCIFKIVRRKSWTHLE